MGKSISLITSYRNRDVIRIRRFLDSLAKQTYREFELIFVDYGSDDAVSTEVSQLCSKYPFCRYLFNDSRGMLWNRSHAMNSGARMAKSDWLLMTDIDLIYTPQVLQMLVDKLQPAHQYFFRAFMLPADFDQFDTLSDLPNNFRRSHFKTKGLFQCMESEVFHRIGGYDEYYSIWGGEDNDLSERIRQSGIQVRWLDNAQAGIYHQWHPSSAKLADNFPLNWWELMSINFHLKAPELSRNNGNYGKLLRIDDRPTKRLKPFTSIIVFAKLNLHGRERVIGDMIFFLREHSGQVLSIRINKPLKNAVDWSRQSRNSMLSKVINQLNALFSRVKLPVTLVHNRPLRLMKTYMYHPDDEVKTPENIQFAIFYLIKHTDLVKDYCIIEKKDYTEYRLMG